jgi:hypothetical protein
LFKSVGITVHYRIASAGYRIEEQVSGRRLIEPSSDVSLSDLAQGIASTGSVLRSENLESRLEAVPIKSDLAGLGPPINREFDAI